MRVVDTSVWIEWIIDSSAGGSAGIYFPPPDEWIVPTMVQLELLKWTTRALGQERAGQILGLTQGLIVVPLTTIIAARAAELCLSHRLATADATIYATALEMGADLLTCDTHFKDLPDVIYIDKRTA
jgi:predicted nucleic acid-binding protein